MAHWISIWGQAHTDIRRLRPDWQGRTCLLTVRSAFDGTAIRLRFSNREGRQPMTMSGAAVAVGDSALMRLSFGGESSVSLAPGQEIYADPLDRPVRRGEYIRLRMAFQSPIRSGNTVRANVHCSVPGDYTAGGPFDTVRIAGNMPIPAVSAVEVLAAEDTAALVCFGDSVTQMGMWTGPLTEALFRCRPGKMSLINKGIGGNRLLHGPFSPTMPRCGRAGVERFERDALDEPGAAAVILALGSNDFLHVTDPAHPEWVTAPMLSEAFVALASRARARGLAIYGATVLPGMGCKGFGERQEAERAAFNDWIRQTQGTVFDQVLDFDAVLRDPCRPERLEMSWDSGDHLHPGPLGGRQMAAEVLKKLL